MKDKTKILYIIPSLAVAGAEKVCCNICDNLDYDKYDVTLISLSGNIPLWETLNHKDKINFYNLNEPEKLGFPWFTTNVFKEVFKLFKAIKPDIVHSHLWGVKCIYLYGYLFLKRKPVFIATIHNSEFIYTSKKLSSKLFKAVENIIYKLLNFHLITISNAVDKMTRKELNFSSITFIENGIDTKLFNPDARIKYKNFKRNIYCNNYPIIVNVGRASEQKRQIDIIKAVSFLKDDYPKIKLLLIGRDNESTYTEIVNDLKLENNIEFIPVTNEVIKYLSIADVGVFPSLYEGLSLAFAEMMSCGLPLVISDIPSLTEMTNYEEAASVVPVKSPYDIAKEVKSLIEDKTRAQVKGQNARRLAVEKYSIDTMVKKHMSLYKSFFNEIL
jgi:glycosyltransferase involved in cell wall biosynthesis